MKKEKIDVNEIIKKAESLGIIKTYEEFCKTSEALEYCVSEEELSYYESLNEKKYDIGDIIFVKKYYYKNGELGENHIFVLIAKNTAVDLTYFGFLLSSNLNKNMFKYNYYIRKDKNNNLNKDSIVKCDDLIFIHSNNILKKIGKVNKNEINLFLSIYNNYIKEKFNI